MQEIIPQHQQLHNIQQIKRASSNPSSTSPTPMGLTNSNSRPHTSASSGCTPTEGTGSIHSGIGGGSSHNSTGAVTNNQEMLQTTLIEHQTPSPPDLLEQTNQHQMISPGYVMVNGGSKLKKTSTPLNLNAATLARTGIGCASVGAPSPVPSTISSVAGGVSPFQRSGTLPTHHSHVANYNVPHYHHPQMCQHHHNCHPRSVSYDHSNNSPNPAINFHNHIGIHGVVGLPPSQPNVKSQNQRPGYVTLPRRPKNASWSAGASMQHQGNIPPYLANQLYATLSRASSTTPTPSQVGSISEHREPIYDGVGPRTSADGSSKLSLSSTMPRPHKRSLPNNGINNGGLTPILKTHGNSPQPSKGSGYGLVHLPPYYAPIQELQDESAPPTPKNMRNKSAPNGLEVNSDGNLLDLSSPNGIMNDNVKKELNGENNHRSYNGVNDSSVTTSGSEQTLMEENMSGYCEPFGTAVLASRGSSFVSHSNSSKDNLLELVDNSVITNDINEARARLSNAELELEAIVSQISNENNRIKDISNCNNNPNIELSEVNPSGDAKNNFNNIFNKNHQKAVNHDNTLNDNSDQKEDVNLSNGNGNPNGNPTYGGVVLKSTLRRKTPPKNNGTNGMNKQKMSRPIPPPKPKKALTSLKKYQDEGADGSEV